MSENNVNNVAQENLSSETLSEINMNPDLFTSGFVQNNVYPGQDVYDALTNQPYNSLPLQNKVPAIPDTPGIPNNVNINAWANQQNDNIFNKLNQAQSWGYDQYQDLKPYTFGTGAKHTSFDRYYHHPKFEEIGFTPFRDNEALYNENSTIMDDLVRGMSQWDDLFASTIKSSYRSLGDIFTGDFFEPDRESAYELEEAMNIGYSSRGGIMGGFNNLALQSAIPVAMGLDFLASELLLGLTGNLPGIGMKAAQTGATVGKMSELLSNFPKLKNFYQGARTAGREALNFALPNTVKNLAEYGAGSNKLLNFANTVGSFADFYKDVRNMNYALSESKLEGGLVKNKLADDLIFEHIQNFGESPDDQTMAKIFDHAQDAGFTTAAINFPIIFATNKVILDNLFTTPKFGARSALEVIDAGLKNGKKLIYDASKIGAGQAFREAGIGEAVKAGLKSLTKPSTYLRNGMSYFRANLMEGLQEVTQEAVSGSTYDYYKGIYQDPSMGGVDYAIGNTVNNIKKQMSAEGFEVFASGFFMGGLMNTMGLAVNAGKTAISSGVDRYYKSKNPETYNNTYEDNKAKNAEIIDSLNKLYSDPMQFFAPDKKTLVENLRINNGLKTARNNGDEKEFVDFSDIAKFNGVYNALSLNRYDSFTTMLKDMKQLDAAELKKALKLDESISDDEANALLDKAIQRAEKIKSNYDSLSKYENPFNPERFRKKQINQNPEIKEQYLAETFAYLGFEEAKKKAVFSVYGFDRARERMQSITEGLTNNPAVEKAQFLDILPLLSQKNLAEEVARLTSEIESLEEATDEYNKKLFANKQAKLNALLNIFTNQAKYGQLQIYLDPESKKIFKDYFKTIADINDSFYEDEKVENAVKAISDYYLLEQDAKNFSNTVNTILNPNAFYQIAAKEAAAFKKIYDEREEIKNNAIKAYENTIGNNEFLNLLYDANIAFDPIYLDSLKEKTAANIIDLIEENDDIEFIDTTTRETFTKKDTEQFARVQAVIDDFQARRPEEDLTKEDVTEEEPVTEVETVTEETPVSAVILPVINNNIDFNKLPSKLKAILTTGNANYNSEMNNEGDEITRPFQFANTARGKKIIFDFFNNPDNAADVQAYNEKIKKAEEPTASVPLTITSQVRQQLYDLGYTKQDVDAMKPETAQDIIAKQTTKPKESTTTDAIADIEKTLYGTIAGSIPLSQALPNGVYIDLGNGLFAYADKNEKIAAIVDKNNNYLVSKSFWNATKNAWQLPNKANLEDDAKKLGVDKVTYIKKYQDAVDSLNAKYDAELAALEDTDVETTVDETVVDDYTIQSEDQLREYSELDQEYESNLAAFEEGQFGSSIEYRVAQTLVKLKVGKEDLVRYAGKSILEGEKGGKRSRQYTRKGKEETRAIDDIAREASDDETEVTIQDIVDFIEDYPAGVGNKNSKSRDSFYGYHNPKLDPKYSDIKEIKKAIEDYYSSQVKSIRPELRGKVIYVTPGSGKTAASKISDDVIDGDDLLFNEVRNLSEYYDTTIDQLPGVLAEISQNPEQADDVYNNALQVAQKLAGEGKTVVFGSRRLIPEVDIVITSAATEENNKRIIKKFTDSGQVKESAQRSLVNIRTSENKVKNKIVINDSFDAYVFGDVKTITPEDDISYEKLKQKIDEARSFDDLRMIEVNFTAQGFVSDIDKSIEFINLLDNKRKELKENLIFENVKVGDILLMKDNSKNNIVKEITNKYILAFKPDGTMVTILKENFNNEVDMIYNHQAQNEDEVIMGAQPVEKPTGEDLENINKNLEEYSAFVGNTDAISEASKEADAQSSEEVDNEFLDDLGC